MITWLIGKGLSERAAKAMAVGAAIFAFLAVAVPAVLLWDYFDDKEAVEKDRLAGNNKALTARLEAAEQSAREALENQATNADLVEAYNDAIDNPKPGDSDDPDIRLACEQLRRDGQDTTTIPECGKR